MQVLRAQSLHLAQPTARPQAKPKQSGRPNYTLPILAGVGVLGAALGVRHLHAAGRLTSLRSQASEAIEMLDRYQALIDEGSALQRHGIGRTDAFLDKLAATGTRAAKLTDRFVVSYARRHPESQQMVTEYRESIGSLLMGLISEGNPHHTSSKAQYFKAPLLDIVEARNNFVSYELRDEGAKGSYVAELRAAIDAVRSAHT